MPSTLYYCYVFCPFFGNFSVSIESIRNDAAKKKKEEEIS
jgi:hypothetical protein